MMQLLGMQCGPKYAIDILVVDDQPLNQKIIFSMLVKLGCDPNRIFMANDGHQAIEIFQEFPSDLILMDCHMPILDGFETAREIRILEQKKGQRLVPIIAFTSDESMATRKLAEAVGMNDYLSKPYRFSALRDMIKIYAH
ncbi:MAG: response regulator [Magnetococcus sp. YQC-3]